MESTGTLLVGLVRRRLTMGNLKQALNIAGLFVFMRYLPSFRFVVLHTRIPRVERSPLDRVVVSTHPAGQLGFLVFINVGIFLLAFFLDFFEIAFIVLPLIAPIAHKTGIDMVWLTVLIAVNLQTSFMHPPFGIALYNLRSVAPKAITTPEIYWGAVPFVLIQLLMVAILIAAPQIVSRNLAASINPANIKIEIPPPE